EWQSQSLLDHRQPTLERSVVCGAEIARMLCGDGAQLRSWGRAPPPHEDGQRRSDILASLGGVSMSRNVRCGLIQASNALNSRSLPQVKKAMIDKHLKLIEQAAKKKVKILCLQELFYGPY